MEEQGKSNSKAREEKGHHKGQRSSTGKRPEKFLKEIGGRANLSKLAPKSALRDRSGAANAPVGILGRESVFSGAFDATQAAALF